jgi:hypothetical protein
MYRTAVPELVMAVKKALGTNDKISSVFGNIYKTRELLAPLPVGITQFVCAVAAS